ncbi:MAG: LTA synthase family protein, partial [Bacilli bacterium]
FFISKFKYNKNKKYFKNTLIVCFTLLILLILSCNSNDLYRLRNDWNKEYTVNNFGVYTYQIKDIMYTLSRSLCKDCGKNKALKEVNEYYKTKKEATSNKYTNIFKGKNLLFVHAESIQTMFVDKELNGNKLMPNLSKIANEGIYFDNYYSQESVGTSSDTEFTLNNSLLPIGTGTVFVNFENNNYESIPKILKQQNYYTFSMHANVCNFWNRDKMYQSMGYDHFYCYNDYDLSDKLGLGLSDKSFFKQSVAKIKDMKVDNFYGTLIMLSNHTPFNGNDEINKFDVSIKQDGKVYPYVENTKIGRYLKMVHYADAAIGDLIKQLDEASLLDNTVIIIYGDHDSKLKTKEYDRYLNYNINTNSILDKKDLNYEEINFYKYEEISRVPFIIWTKDNQIKEKVSQVMGTIDILPTLGNMFGFKSKYALGNDIFSIKDNMVVFPNGNWVTNSVYYNNQTSDYKVFNEVDDIYLKDKESKAKKIVEISNYLIKYNLFNK